MLLAYISMKDSKEKSTLKIGELRGRGIIIDTIAEGDHGQVQQTGIGYMRWGLCVLRMLWTCGHIRQRISSIGFKFIM